MAEGEDLAQAELGPDAAGEHPAAPEGSKPSGNSTLRVDSIKPFTHTVNLKLAPETLANASRGDRILSPEFEGGGLRWAIMSLVGGDTSAPGHVSVYLTLVSPNASIRAAFDITVGPATLREEALVSFDTTPNFRLFDRGWAKALPHAEALKWLEENDNVLPVTVTVRPQLRHAVERPLCQPMDAPGVSVPPPSLGRELGALLAAGRAADVTLLCHGERVRAHRLLLSLRSPVFAALLDDESPLRCKDLAAVPVPDEVQPQALRALCQFLYTDEQPELSTSEEWQHLFNAADHYALPRLRAMCERALCRSLSAENAALTLLLADQHLAESVRENALTFIGLNAAEVIDTPGWHHMCAARPALVHEVMRTMAIGSPPKPSWKRGGAGAGAQGGGGEGGAGAAAGASGEEEEEDGAEGGDRGAKRRRSSSA